MSDGIGPVKVAGLLSTVQMTTSSRRITPGQALPYLLLTLTILPILVGYAWVLIATTHGQTDSLHTQTDSP